MAKRAEVRMSDDECRELACAARRRGQPIAHVVRESLRRTLAEERELEDPVRRIAAVLRFARFTGPTGDIDRLLGEIECGRGLS